MTSFGTYIRGAREQRKLTIDQVAQATRIHPDLLRSLEEDRSHLLPPLPIVKGFVRSYARFLGLPPDPTILRYLVFREAEEAGPSSPPMGRRERLAHAVRRLRDFLTGNDGHQVF